MKMEDYNEYYIQGSDHYLIPKDEFKELFNEMVNLKEESKKQKEIINKAIELLGNYKHYSTPDEKQVDNWNKLKEWASNFYNSEEVGWAGCGMRYTLEKILELENETANNCNDCKQCKEVIIMGKQIPFKMRNVYDLDDYYVLEQNGWKLPSNNTLKGYKKQQLIEIVRMLEHNWAGEIKANMLQNKRLENFYNYYKEKGQEELFSKIIDKENNEEKNA